MRARITVNSSKYNGVASIVSLFCGEVSGKLPDFLRRATMLAEDVSVPEKEAWGWHRTIWPKG
jgi:hypothetical protein